MLVSSLLFKDGEYRKHQTLRQRWYIEYYTWSAIKARCYNKNASHYNYYGGRGITVCDKWRDSFVAFLLDMGPRPVGYSIDRINSNGNYEPSNCHWVNHKTQMNNTRKTKAAQAVDNKIATFLEA